MRRDKAMSAAIGNIFFVKRSQKDEKTANTLKSKAFP